MWLVLAFVSAALLGCYDVAKKRSLQANAVMPVLLLNTVFCSLFFLPVALASAFGAVPAHSPLYVPPIGWPEQGWVLLKSLLVLGSWICGYYGIKHLPLTLVGPINATRPVMVLVGAVAVFGERLNAVQWAGAAVGILSFYLLSRSGKKEGVDFFHNRWVGLVVAAAVLGAASGLYDKFLMAPANEGGLALCPIAVQCHYNFYQAALMAAVWGLLWWPRRRGATPFAWRWQIVLISVFLTLADFAYFSALSLDGAMVSVVSMVRRGSVVVSFVLGAWLFAEKNLRSKAIDLLLVLLGLVLLYIGSK